jgi:hypothetical protein
MAASSSSPKPRILRMSPAPMRAKIHKRSKVRTARQRRGRRARSRRQERRIRTRRMRVRRRRTNRGG